MRSIRPVTERFWEKVYKTDTCWLWTACRNEDGYGIFRDRGMKKAHRVAYELLVGPIPQGMQLDHTCHARACVNPAHLRPVTNKQNGENRVGANLNSESGVRGVRKVHGKWRARVIHNYKPIHVGYFDTLDEAKAAASEARGRLFTHNVQDQVSA